MQFVLLVNHDSIALTPLPWDKIFKIYSHMCNTWVHLPEIACHSIRMNYLGVHGDVMGKHGADELTRGSRCAVHLSWTR